VLPRNAIAGNDECWRPRHCARFISLCHCGVQSKSGRIRRVESNAKAEINVMADRSSFWKMVDRTKPNQLRAFAESELRDCQNYFLEIQSDSTLPPKEIITASERLALIRSEIDLRHGDAKHGQTQRLARWAIGVGMVSLTIAIVFGVAQRLANRPTRENWPAAIETLTVTTPPPTASPSPSEKAASPWPAASPTAPPKAKPTPKKAKAERKPRRAARPMPAGRTTEAAANPPAPGGGHFQVWVNTETRVYHRQGSRFYGTTRKGKYMTEQDAIQAGYKPAPKGP
jgi:hypothetical protein